MFKKTLIAAAIATLAGGAYAESQGMYMGGGIGAWNIDETGYEDTAMSARISGGYKFNEYIGMEASYLYLGEVEDTIGGIDLQVDGTGWEVAVRPSYPFTESLEGYARLGWGTYDVKGQALGVSVSEDDDAFVWAVGGAWAFNDNLSFFGEYSEPDLEADVYVMTFGASYNF